MKRWWILSLALVLVVGAALAGYIVFYRPVFFSLVNENPKMTVTLAGDMERVRQVYATRLLVNNIKRVKLRIAGQPSGPTASGETNAWKETDGTELVYGGYEVNRVEDLVEITVWVDADLMRRYDWDEGMVDSYIAGSFLKALGKMHTKAEKPESREEDAKTLMAQVDYAQLFAVGFNQNQ